MKNDTNFVMKSMLLGFFGLIVFLFVVGSALNYFVKPETESERITRICSANYSDPEDIAQCRLTNSVRIIEQRDDNRRDQAAAQIGN